MLDILIVDDSERKLRNLRAVLQPYVDARKGVVSECSSIVDAKRILMKKQFGLVVLDIQLPAHPGEAPRKDGGIEILRELHTRTIYKKPFCIVGLTEYDDIQAAAAPQFADQCWTIVLYDEAGTEWADRLQRKLEYLLATMECPELNTAHVFDLGIITALPAPEFESVLRLDSWQDHAIEGDGTKYHSAIFSSPCKKLKVIATCAPQMGMPATAVAASKLISHFRPRYLAMVGIAAGVRGAVNLGDAVVADPSWDWSTGKRKATAGGPQTDPDPLQERLPPHLKALFHDVQRDAELLSRVQSDWPGDKRPTSLQLHVGPLASGGTVLADGETISEILKHNRKLVGIDMETYGLMYAAANAVVPRPLAFSLKAICDFADNKKDDSAQRYAAYISATLLRRIALKYFAPLQ